jgi:hypothetical protein
MNIVPLLEVKHKQLQGVEGLLFRCEIQRKGINAVAQAGSVLRAVVKDMAKVSATLGTHNFSTGHAV